ncbi:interleukin-6 receptor subunit beta isoform X1 [Carassius gibelio]|uniref:interleukin-6 receptor subunit beta isoform X1 n=1 Tax=Carassius gibelio TaxID=101364 RepID=UPI002278DF98|nr:interleukin-6 receptor subunit beta isoform X1 [Carassius gibelio]XP_052460983.1 interleukin-6 receptor subunit beta isoform X1 [Carassius gibelio]
MNCRRSVCIFICVFCFCSALGDAKHTFSIQELTVSPKDLKGCGEKNKLCVKLDDDCLSISSDGAPQVPRTPENFLNTSCHYLIQEESLTCRWIQTNHIRSQTTNSFILSQAKYFCYPTTILNIYSTFNLTIKTKNVISLKEQFSDVILVRIQDIIKAPRPLITFVNVTDSSINITWTTGKEPVTKCKIRYKCINTESWTETADLPSSVESWFVIEGLQAFSEYRLRVSCSHRLGRWSDWSDETRVKTSESLPSAAPSLSYYVDSDENSRIRQLVLLWKALDVKDARGLIRGYEVSYKPIRQPSLKKTINTTHLKVIVPVRSEEYEVSVCAFNSVGCSAHRRITLDASRSHGTHDVPAVKSLWVYSDDFSLWVSWEHEFTAANVSEFAIEWSAMTDREHRRWERVPGSTFTVCLPGIEAKQTYIISVFPVYGSLCGPPASISADLQHGALLDLVRFRLLYVSSSSVAVQWTWQEAEPSVSVLQYRLVLNGPLETQTLTVFPNKEQHLFLQLHPNTRYSIHVQGETTAGNFSKASLDISTPLLDYDEMLSFAVPVLLLLLVVGIFSILTRTMCREYFFPFIANPRYSLIGRWLLDPQLQGTGSIYTLKLDHVFLPEKSIIQLEHCSSLSDQEDVIPLKICASAEHTAVENTLASSGLPEYVDSPSLPESSGYVQTG